MGQSERDPYNAYDDYDPYADDEGYQDTASNASYLRGEDATRRSQVRPDALPLVEQALDWGLSGSVLAILVLTALYVFFPDDVMIPFAGQADDLAAVLAGTGTIGVLTAMRFILRTRVGHWSCLIAIVVSATGAFIIFWVLTALLSAVF